MENKPFSGILLRRAVCVKSSNAACLPFESQLSRSASREGAPPHLDIQNRRAVDGVQSFDENGGSLDPDPADILDPEFPVYGNEVGGATPSFV